MAKNYNVTYEKDALSSFLDELPGLLNQYKLSQAQSALAHEKALELKTLDQVDPKYYEYNNDGNIDIKSSMLAQQEGVKWQLAGASAGLNNASSFAYGTEDESAGAYTHDDYSRDKSAINELTLSENIGYNDALNIINMGLFDMEGDELLPGGASAEDMAESMTEGNWWNENKGKIRKRSDSYFQGVLMNPQFMDTEKYQSYKANEVAIRQTELENLITQPTYTTAKETVNTLMDAEGAWQAKAGLKSINDDGETQYYNPNTGKEMDLDDFAKKFSATYQLMTSSQPLEWMYEHYKNGGQNNAVIKQLIKESPNLAQNYIMPLFSEMDTITGTRAKYEAGSVALTDFSEPTAIPKDLDTALKAFQTSDPSRTGDPNIISGADWAAFYSNTEGDSLRSYINNISAYYGEDISNLQFIDLDTDQLLWSISKAEGYGVAGAIPTTHNNPGNLKYIGQPGATQGQLDKITNDGTYYARFETEEDGIAALRADIEAKKSRISSGGGLSPGAPGTLKAPIPGPLSANEERIRVLVGKGVDPEYINTLGSSIAQYTDDDILYASWENAYIEKYDPRINSNAYEDINNIQNLALKEYVVGRLNPEQSIEFKQYIERVGAGVDNITALLPGLTDELINERRNIYAKERQEYINANNEYKDRYAEKWALESEIAGLKESLSKLHDLEYNEGGDMFYNVPFAGFGQAASVVNAGQSQIAGATGKNLYEEIQQKEAALSSLNHFLGHTIIGQLSPGQVSSASSISAPGLEALVRERQEAETAKRKLQRLIKENLDDLPDLYRTSGGR